MKNFRVEVQNISNLQWQQTLYLATGCKKLSKYHREQIASSVQIVDMKLY